MSQVIDLREPINAIAHKFVSMGGDCDYHIYERYFSGRMTKARYKALDGYCRRNTFRMHCHHDHDCCGCMTSQRVTFSYSRNCVVVSLSQHYNY